MTRPRTPAAPRPRGLTLGLVSALLVIACTPARTPGGSPAHQKETEPKAGPAPVVSVSRVADAAAPAEEAPPAAPPSDGRVVLPTDFPEGTISLQVTDLAHVLGRPDDRARYIGKITRGTRVTWQRVVAPDPEPQAGTVRRKRIRKPCPAWVQIHPRGYLCRTLVSPSKQPPGGQKQPVLAAGKLVPATYFQVKADETPVFETADTARAGTALKLLSTKVMVVGHGKTEVDGAEYQKTDHGLIGSDALGMFWPSDFEGRSLRAARAADAPDTAWVFFERGARKPPVFADASTKSEKLRTAARRELYPVLEERDGFVRVADGEWLERKHLRVLHFAPPPAGVGEGAQWLDVDLDEQTLVAYEGTSPVFATLVSTGGRKNPTPPAMYRVRAKAATTSMAGDPDVPNRYEVSAVPWAIRFGNGLYVHGVYWHDGFGGPRSHGCVNVAPKDAALLFEWLEPALPEGWSEVEVPGGEGAIVRVRSRKDPDPAPFDYSREEPWNYPANAAR